MKTHLLLIFLACGSSAPLRADEKLFREAATILEERCLRCHSHASSKGGLSLETAERAKAGGENGAALEPGKPAESLLIQYVSGAKPEMPKDGSKLTRQEVAVLEKWIAAGGKWVDGVKLQPKSVLTANWWSLQPIQATPLPAVPQRQTARNAIDVFILTKLAETGLEPAPEADRRTLLRRLSFDLLGLPPTPDDVAAFAADTNPDAYERLVDRQLAAPQFGERWARHWLDVVHFGETHGYDKDQPRPNAWPYRDYVIRAFNQDKPYARFVQEQIAGDVLYPGTADGIEALGFLSAGPWDLIGHAEVPESKIDGKVARHLDRDDMVVNTIMTFNSVTVGCAQCHDHKFDPIKQEDYYSLQACFAALDRADKRYDVDPLIAAQRHTLEARQKELAASKKTLDDQIAKSAGKRLEELDQQLAAAARPPTSAPPEHGYHSGLEAKQDVAKWVQIDLGQPTKIEKLVLVGCYDDFNQIGAGFGFPVRFKIELADDAEIKTNVQLVVDHTAADVANPGTAPQTKELGGKTGRFLRVTATKLAPRQNDYIFALAELSVLDATGTNVARGAAVAALDSIEAPNRWSKRNLVDGVFAGSASTAADLAGLKKQREELLQKSLAPEQQTQLAALTRDLATVAGELARLPTPMVVYSGMIHTGGGAFAGTGPFGGKPRAIHILPRGDVTKPGPEVTPGTLSFFAHLPGRFALPASHAEGDRRAALAHWLTEPSNSLTWRSIVNRLWLYHFGRGIVETPNDLGRMGQLPSHPELLEWLAAELREGTGNGSQSLKKLHRLIVNSSTYRQASERPVPRTSSPAPSPQPPAPSLYASFPRRRLDAEAIRDSLLVVAGRMDWRMGGPSFQDFKIEHPAHSPHYEYHLHDPESPVSQRRSVYRFLVRSNTQPFMTTLDCADPSLQVDKRNQTITPLQALALLNNQLTVVLAKHFAQRLEAQTKVPAEQISLAFRLALAREPSADEAAVLSAYLREHGLPNTCRVILNLNEFVFVD